MVNIAAGVEKDNWLAELYVRNLTSEEGAIVQTAGKFSPEASVNRPRTVGLETLLPLLIRHLSVVPSKGGHCPPFFISEIKTLRT